MRQTRALPACFTAKSPENSCQWSVISDQFVRADNWLLITDNFLRRGFRGKLFFFHALAQNHRQVASCRIEDGHQALRRSIDEEQQLREELFLARQGGQRLHFGHIQQLAVHDAQLELELSVFANPL